MYKNCFKIEGMDLPEPLSDNETINLLSDSKTNKISRNKLIIHNIRLVIFRINAKFSNVEYDKNDLFSIGILGLIKAIEGFNLEKSVKFSSYATVCIDNEILQFLRKLKKDKNCYSLENETEYENRNFKLCNILADDQNIEEDYEDKELYQIVRNIVDKLPLKEQQIIKLYFGFNGKRYKQVEIANIIGISQGYVARSIKRILIKIKKELELNDLIYENKKIYTLI